MNAKSKSLASLLSLAVIATFATVSVDMAWSEVPRKSSSKVKKAKVAKKKPRPQESVPAAPVAAVAPAPAQEITASAPVPSVPAVATSAPANPYITVPQPNPWQVQAAKPAPTPGAPVNPYLAYRYAAPAATPWNTLPMPLPMPPVAQPVWNTPFPAFKWPFPQVAAVPATPWTAPAVQLPSVPVTQYQPPRFAAPLAYNPYLPRPQASVPAAPAAQATPWSVPLPFPQFPVPAAQPAQQAALPPIPWAMPAAPISPMPVAPVPQAFAPVGVNPYLAYRQMPFVQPTPQAAEVQSAPQPVATATPFPTPWTVPTQSAEPARTPAPATPTKSLGDVLESLKYAILPGLPPEGQAILPVIKTVYPTGEKPLKVLTFKCPTELVGITPIPTKALHGLVNMAMDGLNSTNLLPFNMQQVCQ